MERNLVDKGIDADELDVTDEVDEHEREQHRPARRWWIGGGAVVSLLAAGGVAFLVTRDDGVGGDDPSGDRAVPTAVPPGEAPPPELDWRLVIDEVPDGYELQWISAPEAQNGGFEEFGVVSRVQLFAGADADMEDGPWMSVSVQLLDRFERRNFDPMNYVDPSQATSTRVGAYVGAFYDDPFAGTSSLIFGPVDDGYAVSIGFAGIDRGIVSRVAAELTIAEQDGATTGRAEFGPAAAELGLELLADYEDSSWGIGAGAEFRSLFGGSADATSITYESDIGGLTLTNKPLIPGVDPLTIGGFALTDEEAVTVHGLPALVGEFGGFGFDITAVVWVEGGRSMSLIGVVEPDDLVAVAESVREASVDEFDELLAQVEEFQGEEPGLPEESWLFGMGDLEDSTTWSVEGNIDLEGEAEVITLCSSSFSSSGESSSGCGGTVDVVVPSIAAGPTVGLQEQYPTLVAMVDSGQDGAVLRFTADDGTVTESPLRIVRDDWPVRLVAIVVEQPGRAELIGSDGVVLSEREISEDDFLQGDVAGAADTTPADTAGG